MSKKTTNSVFCRFIFLQEFSSSNVYSDNNDDKSRTWTFFAVLSISNVAFKTSAKSLTVETPRKPQQKITLKSTSILSKRSESSGSCFLMSSEPMKMLSRCDQVRWTSIQIVMTMSAVDSFFCQPDTSSRKYAMNLDVSMFCSCTWTRYVSEIHVASKTTCFYYMPQHQSNKRVFNGRQNGVGVSAKLNQADSVFHTRGMTTTHHLSARLVLVHGTT